MGSEGWDGAASTTLPGLLENFMISGEGEKVRVRAEEEERGEWLDTPRAGPGWFPSPGELLSKRRANPLPSVVPLGAERNWDSRT